MVPQNRPTPEEFDGLPSEGLGTMEELLLPTEGEETRSNNSSYSPSGETMYQRVNRFLHGAFVDDLKQWLRDYLKRNGLLTLSVFAVLAGCLLGFILRGSHLSTQVRGSLSQSRMHVQMLLDCLKCQPARSICLPWQCIHFCV